MASVYILVSGVRALGESRTYYQSLAIGLEVLVLALILRYAWNWPRTAAPVITDHLVAHQR